MKKEYFLYLGSGLALSGIIFYYYWINRKSATGSNQKMSFPVPGSITSPYGYRIHPVDGQAQFHNGIDIKGGVGDPVKAPADGQVTDRFSNSTGGNQLIIKHTNGLTTGYAHLSKYYVNKGDQVKKGQLIAEVGATGTVTGPHLHLTLKDQSNQYLNPVDYFA